MSEDQLHLRIEPACVLQYKDSQELAQLCPGEEEEGH